MTLNSETQIQDLKTPDPVPSDPLQLLLFPIPNLPLPRKQFTSQEKDK